MERTESSQESVDETPDEPFTPGNTGRNEKKNKHFSHEITFPRSLQLSSARRLSGDLFYSFKLWSQKSRKEPRCSDVFYIMGGKKKKEKHSGGEVST